MSFRAVLAFVGLLTCHVAFAAPNQAPTVSISAPAAGTSLPAPATVTIKATAGDIDGTITKVQFFHGTTQIGSDDTTLPYEVTHTFTAAGTYSLTAKATDNGGKTATSAAVQVQVIMFTTTITSPTNNSAIQGRSVGVSGGFTGGDTATVIVTAGGGHSTLATLSGATYGATVALAPGSNKIEVQVARRDGTSETASVDVMAVDPPVVAYTAPTSCRAYRVGDTETYTVDAASAQGAIAEVRFFDNGAPVGPALTAPPFSAGITFTAVGNHSITAQAKDSFGFVTTSAALNVNVATAAPVATVTSPTDGQRFRAGAPVTLTATASDSDGSVSSLHYFANNGGGDIRIEGGTTAPYQATWSPPTYGTYTIRAVAVDNTNVEGASASISITVNRPPSVTVTSPANGGQFTAPATIVVSADALDLDGGSITKVRLMNGAALIEEKTAPPYQASVPNLPAGTYQFSAVAFDNDGDSTQSASVAVTVAAPPNQPPTISLGSPSDGASFTAPTDITLSATAGDADGTVAKVEFFDGANLLATLTTTPYSYTWPNAGLGPHTVQAKVTDNLGATASATATITVNGTLVSISQPQDGANFNAPATYQIVANVATSSGLITKVEFLDGAQVIALADNVNLASATIPFTYENVPAGQHVHTVRATHSTGPVYVSTAVTVNVSTPPSVTLNSPVQEENFIAPASLWLQATPGGFTGPVTVRFYSGSTLIGESSAAPYEVVWHGVGQGNYVISAVASSGSSEAQSSQKLVTVRTTPEVDVAVGIDGSSVADNQVSINGVVRSPANTSIRVNGRSALIHESGNWYVDDVKLEPGANTLTVRTSVLGAPDVTQNITVNSTGISPYELSVGPAEGLAPLTVYSHLVLRGTSTATRVEFDADSDGSAEANVPLVGGSATAAFAYGVGFYRLTAKVYDAANILLYTASKVIVVHTPEFVGRRVSSVYLGMVGRLLSGDKAGALSAISSDARSVYQPVLDALGSNLSTVGSQLGVMEVRSVSSEVAELVVVRQSADGPKAFPILLHRDVDGLWRIGGM